MGSLKHATLNQNGKGIMKTSNKIKIKPKAVHSCGGTVFPPTRKHMEIQFVFSAPFQIGIGQNPVIPAPVHPVDPVLPLAAAGASTTTTMSKL